jgi:hypothetical protein
LRVVHFLIFAFGIKYLAKCAAQPWSTMRS